MAVKKNRAFSLVELILTVVIVAIVSAVCLPRLNYAFISQKTAGTSAEMITSDIRRPRSLAIVNAATNTSGFTLNMIGSSPYHSYKIVDLSNSTTVDTITLDSAVGCTGGNSFPFGPLGNCTGTNTSLTVSSQGKSYTITIISATGIAKCTQN